MRNSSSLDWLRFMHTPNDYPVSYTHLSHQVTANNYTMLRGLAMDFTTDTRTFDIDNGILNLFIFNPETLLLENLVAVSLDVYKRQVVRRASSFFWNIQIVWELFGSPDNHWGYA